MREIEEVEEIDLMELSLALLRKWPFLLLAALIGGLLAGGLTSLKTPQYQSEAMIFAVSKTTTITSLTDLQLGTAMNDDYLEIALSKPVLDTAIEQIQEQMDITLTREQIRNMVSVTNENNTHMIVFSAVCDDPVLACNLANDIMEATAYQMSSIMKTDLPTTVERAEVSPEPLDNGMVKNVILGVLIGLALMAMVISIQFVCNDRIRTVEDVEKYLDGSVLAVIPVDRAQNYKADKRKKGLS